MMLVKALSKLHATPAEHTRAPSAESSKEKKEKGGVVEAPTHSSEAKESFSQQFATIRKDGSADFWVFLRIREGVRVQIFLKNRWYFLSL